VCDVVDAARDERGRREHEVAAAVADEGDDGADGNGADAAAQVHAHEEGRIGLPQLGRRRIARDDRLHDRLGGSDAEADEGGGHEQQDGVVRERQQHEPHGERGEAVVDGRVLALAVDAHAHGRPRHEDDRGVHHEVDAHRVGETALARVERDERQDA